MTSTMRIQITVYEGDGALFDLLKDLETKTRKRTLKALAMEGAALRGLARGETAVGPAAMPASPSPIVSDAAESSMKVTAICKAGID